ncbi:hypothetical protein HK405_005515 [Cladochytrium tenue]|nr:hypothetical protein HK405_005515 [Cladochytrium tenue]
MMLSPRAAELVTSPVPLAALLLSLLGTAASPSAAAPAPASYGHVPPHGPGGGHAGKHVYSTRFDGVTWDDDAWRLTTTVLEQGRYQARMSMANGYLGINLASVGPFFEADDASVGGDPSNGWPLFDQRQTFATVAGFYDNQPTTNGTNFLWLNQYGGESVISGVPHWAGLHVLADLEDGSTAVLDASVDPSTISGYSSSLDIKSALLSWSYTWSPSATVSLDLAFSMFVHKLEVNKAAVSLQLSSKTAASVRVIDVLNGDCAVRTEFVGKSFEQDSNSIWSAVSPNGVANVTAYVYSTLGGDFESSSRVSFDEVAVIGSSQASIAQAVRVKIPARGSSTIYKFIGGASSDAFAGDPQGVARDASAEAASSGFDALLASHSQEWASILTSYSVDSFADPTSGKLPINTTSGEVDTNILDLHIMAVTNPFHILQNTVGANATSRATDLAARYGSSESISNIGANSISVCGLGGDCYAGFIFWDAEVWMAPGIVVAFPDAAKQVAEYRVKKLPQAMANVDTAFTSSQNTTGKFSHGGAVYSWTSARYGNCTGTGPCFDYEYHINGDIGVELYNYFAVTGDTTYLKNSLFPVYDAIAYFYGELVALNETSGKYVLTNATDPDEFANNVNNPGYTMVLIKKHLENANIFRSTLGLATNETWSTISSNIDIPVDSSVNIILEFDGMTGIISVKQADVILVDDLLDYENSYSSSDLDFYAGQQSAIGPAMTYSVFSIVANRIASSGCAGYTYDLFGAQPYLRGPWFQISEQINDNYTINGGTHPAYPFLTGSGGANRVAVFGFLGLRLLLDSLNVDPALPPQIPHLTYRTIYWQGIPVRAFSNQTHTVLTRPADLAPLASASASFASGPIPVTVGFDRTNILSLAPGGSITIANRRPADSLAVPGNLVQCPAAASSAAATAPGQLPLAAVDGSPDTKWRPASSAAATLLVDAGKTATGYPPLSAVRLDWARNPPARFAVRAANDSASLRAGAGATVVAWTSVVPSSPYDPAAAADISVYTGNVTSVAVADGAWAARFYALDVEGNQGDSSALEGDGPTVAEFAVIAANGSEVAAAGLVRRSKRQADALSF